MIEIELTGENVALLNCAGAVRELAEAMGRLRAEAPAS